MQIAESDVRCGGRGISVSGGAFNCSTERKRPLLAKGPHRPTWAFRLSGQWGDAGVHSGYTPITDVKGELGGVK